MIPATMAFGLYFIVDGVRYFDVLVHELGAMRNGSTGSRMLSYQLALQMTLEHNPITGLGYKPRIPELLHIPIGSHSSIISMFTKGGSVALLMLALIYASLIWKIVRSGFNAAVIAARVPPRE